MNSKNFLAICLLVVIVGIAKADSQAQCEYPGNNMQETTGCPNLYSCIDGACVHKSFFPITWLEIGGIVLIMVVSGVANAGGIGGGTLLSSILIVLFNYNENNSVSLVYAL